MYEPAERRLASWTTLRLGGAAERLVVFTDEEALCAEAAAADARSEPFTVLGSGSNVVVADAGLTGTVAVVGTRGIRPGRRDGGTVEVTVAAGEPLAELVTWSVSEGLAGLESLAGIPGTVGATPVQNVGAYGQEVSDTLCEVRAYDRRCRRMVVLPAARCGLGHRTSRFRRTDRWLLSAVTFRLESGALSAPVRHPEVARLLGTEVSSRVPIAEVPAAVTAIRRTKGMVLSRDDPDTRSVGSFFANPIVSAAGAEEAGRRVGAVPPQWPDRDGVKLSAAWLIERAGWRRGDGLGDIRISTKHALALTNRGGGTTRQLLELAGRIRAGVARTSGVRLEPEPTLLGCTL
ncbi:UDP-N-acetylmuramate dehydrogenase [Embleya hyalina]|uniref:UDP-N-acetylmuramate dehydrogenase n=1 Tax=Embleya hyalina TaxID=516124 RepID=UPI000F817DC1|nr:UDP-N-acetylmuramate dehydrogenase [Embleya hyalina]